MSRIVALLLEVSVVFIPSSRSAYQSANHDLQIIPYSTVTSM